MAKISSEEIILRYNDSVIRQSDLVTLNGPKWLNDRIIEFYFSYLSSFYPSKHILLVPPAITYWIMNCPDTNSLKDFLKPLNLPSKKLIIFPVNNNDDMSRADGGNHWSLLAYEKTDNLFVHHDSLGDMNKSHAKCLYNTLVPYIGASYPIPSYFEYECGPLQDNGYDCGLYVLATTKVICDWYDSYLKEIGHLWFSLVWEQVNTSTVSGLRKEILEVIKSMKGERIYDFSG
ncbi:Peptidase C48, SUMO/Sentrin/Ubl1 [Artemisia annua]|uniref:Peptidase C48, SUMO/Sentrin/Ubl1 n=1 Tax=Artemisia annua TaxID=35608 RepID=A0A2U1QLK9_ARTAN|nr:Peptidase C48, SUMO/Sentrin/Ubl1 [Artemisia annua]